MYYFFRWYPGYSKTREEREENLKVVFQLPKEHKLYGELNKCEFFQTYIQHLGHVIVKGFVVYLKNIKAIME